MTDERFQTGRRFIGSSIAALAGSTALAGCSSGGSSGDDHDHEHTPTDSPSPSPTDAESGDGSSGTEGSYSVSMEPVGTVTFESVPQALAIYCPGYADMAVALGHADAVRSVGLPSRYHTGFYDELDGVSIDTEGLTALYDGGVGKETFYSIDADLHLIDPNWLLNNFKGWEQADVDEVAEQVAPFLGNTIFRRTDAWHDYRYYTMYEAFETVGQVLQEGERYGRFADFHDGFVADVQARLPGADDRPNAALLWQGKDEPEEFYPYRLSDKGTNKKQFHDLGITDAFAQTGIDGLSTNDRGAIDYETLLEVDPDAILLRGHETKTPGEFRDTVLAHMEGHSVASELTAVQNGRVFRGGPIYAGPIQNLFLTERYAKAFYPDVFTESKLFDRSEVSAIVAGN